MEELNPDNSRFYLSRKLIGVVSVFIIAASGLVVLTNFSINMIAATGDYMRLLSTWSEQHHQSVVSLERYIRSGEKADPNMEVIFHSFSTENIYLNEISSLVFAFQQFRNSDKVQSLYRQWPKVKSMLHRLSSPLLQGDYPR